MQSSGRPGLEAWWKVLSDMTTEIITAVPLSILSGVLYRLGGYGPPFNTKVRDFGVPSCMAAYFAITGHWHWVLILCFGLVFGAQTTYFKRKGWDVYWFNWLYCGLAFSFALLPYVWATGHWAGFAWRTLVVTGFTVAISELSGKDWIEEGGRGFVQIITLPLLI